MKIQDVCCRSTRKLSRRIASAVARCLVFGVCLLVGVSGTSGQAAQLAWTTNVGGRAFAVDGQVSVYVAAGTNVILLSGNGVALQTNSICPLGGVAQRNATGDLYFAGSFDGTQNFGGITLVGGWTNNPLSPGQWSPGWPSCYLAKYDANGTLSWVARFGQQGYQNMLSDLLLDNSGGCYAGYWTSANEGKVAHVGSTGGFDWSVNVSTSSGVSYQPIKLGGLTPSNCVYFGFRSDNFLPAGRINLAGSYANLAAFPLRWTVAAATNGQPVINDNAAAFELGRCFSLMNPACTDQVLRLCAADSTELWNQVITPDAQWLLARDAKGHVYVSGSNGMLAQFDATGSMIWSNNFIQPCVGMIVDAAGNRFVSFADGSIGRLQSDASPITPPTLSMSGAGQGYTAAGFRFTLTGTSNVGWHILTSSNLVDWESLGWVTNTDGQVQFTDAAALQKPGRYYKATTGP